MEESEDFKVPTISTLSIGTDSKVVVEEKERLKQWLFIFYLEFF